MALGGFYDVLHVRILMTFDLIGWLHPRESVAIVSRLGLLHHSMRLVEYQF